MTIKVPDFQKFSQEDEVDGIVYCWSTHARQKENSFKTEEPGGSIDTKKCAKWFAKETWEENQWEMGRIGYCQGQRLWLALVRRKAKPIHDLKEGIEVE